MSAIYDRRVAPESNTILKGEKRTDLLVQAPD
jgi:hypothetical protein